MLDEFLLARIAEDEAEAQRAIETLKDPALLGRVIPGWHSWPQRLAECAAKRAVIETYQSFLKVYDEGSKLDLPVKLTSGGGVAALEVALKHLALPYADHPDFDKAWLPS